MTKSKIVFVLSLFTLGLLASKSSAHHGWSWYGNDAFTLTATVLVIDFGNPHDRMTVEADGQQWNLLLSPPGRTRRAGLSAEMIQVGDTITAYGHRDKDADNYEMKTERLQIGETLFDLYPNRD